jgi:hypothetical protein
VLKVPKIDLKLTDFLKRNFYFETEGVCGQMWLREPIPICVCSKEVGLHAQNMMTNLIPIL